MRPPPTHASRGNRADRPSRVPDSSSPAAGVPAPRASVHPTEGDPPRPRLTSSTEAQARPPGAAATNRNRWPRWRASAASRSPPRGRRPENPRALADLEIDRAPSRLRHADFQDPGRPCGTPAAAPARAPLLGRRRAKPRKRRLPSPLRYACASGPSSCSGLTQLAHLHPNALGVHSCRAEVRRPSLRKRRGLADPLPSLRQVRVCVSARRQPRGAGETTAPHRRDAGRIEPGVGLAEHQCTCPPDKAGCRPCVICMPTARRGYSCRG